MGMSILDLVLMKLKQYGFTADVAFPGQKYPAISDTVAAVIWKAWTEPAER